MSSRRCLLTIFCTTLVFTLLGSHRILKAALLSHDRAHSFFVATTTNKSISANNDTTTMVRRRREFDEVFFVPEASRHEVLQNNNVLNPQQAFGQQRQMAQQKQRQQQQAAVSKGRPAQHNPKIRSWGCEKLHDLPFIFVHVGKAGGGVFRSRLIASAKIDAETSSQNHDNNNETWYYFPILINGVEEKVPFVNSHIPNFRPSYNTSIHRINPLAPVADEYDAYEGTLPCAAETPLGNALACPLLRRPAMAKSACHGTQCHMVYAGHNYVGNELHWLPDHFLAQWWKQTTWHAARTDATITIAKTPISSARDDGATDKKVNAKESGDGEDEDNDDDATSSAIKKGGTDENHQAEMVTVSTDLVPAFQKRLKDWIVSQNISKCWLPREITKPILTYRHYRKHYTKCIQPKESHFDQIAWNVMSGSGDDRDSNGRLSDWSSVYASLPVLRVVMLREPMSWLVSQYFWHSKWPGFHLGISGRRHYNLTTCDNSDKAVAGSDDHLELVVDWVSYASLTYIHSLCGEDCVVRMKHGTLSLKDAEIQARHNLQKSFAIVGILEESQSFYEMVTARTSYLNVSFGNQEKRHQSKPGGYVHDKKERCQEVFTSPDDKTFARALTSRSAELAVLRRLYRVAVQVYQAQREELEACGSLESSYLADAAAAAA